MLIGMLMAAAIICLLLIGPSFENVWVAIAVYGGIIGGMLLVWWYSARLSGGVAGFLSGDSVGGKVKETYSLAEKYEVEHKYKAATDLYKRAFEKDKKNPAPRKKLADLYYRLRDYDNCLKYMQEALSLPGEMSEAERCDLMNRIADVYLQHKRDRASAVAILRRIINEFPSSKYAVYARDRIMQIKQDG
jgi:tetratricopeptide (TPR) repeat protein